MAVFCIHGVKNMVLIFILDYIAQALYVMCNVASGSEVHKDAVLTSILTSQSTNNSSWLTRFLQDMSNPQLRVVAVWCIINLLYPAGDGISSRAIRLREAGVEAQLHKMVDDSCLDVKVITLLILFTLYCFVPSLVRSVFESKRQALNTHECLGSRTG